MKILVACEESQAVCKEFRLKGHEAYSCDLEQCSGGCPQWHICANVLPLLNGNCEFYTCDGARHYIPGKWDMIIAFPPCTYLTNTGNSWFNVQKYGQRALDRMVLRESAVNFFMRFVNADCERIAVENPVGHMSTRYQKPSQIVHPYMFGDAERKATCLWLKGLPLLIPTNIVKPNIVFYKNGKGTDSLWHMRTMSLPPKERAKMRSKTFPGIASAMAEQWGCMEVSV